MTSERWKQFFQACMAAIMVGLMAGCAAPAIEMTHSVLATSPWGQGSITDGAKSEPWRHQEFPGKRPSSYRYMKMDGRDAVKAESSAAASMVRHAVRVEPDQLNRLRFSWRVPQLIEAADLSVREKADSPVRVVLAFEGDRSRFSAKNAMLSELAQVLTGEPMPYATLMYVWCNRQKQGEVVINPRTDRIRKIALESGPGNLNRWLDYDRDIRADFMKAFGEPPGALVAVGIMTDTDNTGSTAWAWYGPITLVKARD